MGLHVNNLFIVLLNNRWMLFLNQTKSKLQEKSKSINYVLHVYWDVPYKNISRFLRLNLFNVCCIKNTTTQLIQMKNKHFTIIKLFLIALFSLMWFILIQAMYEMITKPELQNDFPIIKGIYAVYFLGVILLILGIVIVFLFFSIIKLKKYFNSIKWFDYNQLFS